LSIYIPCWINIEFLNQGALFTPPFSHDHAKITLDPPISTGMLYRRASLA
jgi:hypothetical protein